MEIDSVNLTRRDATGCVAELGERLHLHGDDYLARLGLALQSWARLFQ